MQILPPPPPGGKISIKKAKANFRARNPAAALSERERKQLARAGELERRAWRSKEIARRNAESALQRAEKDKRQREEDVKLLGSQMCCDRFGHKSSQFHLGAFFGNGARKQVAGSDRHNVARSTEIEMCRTGPDVGSFEDSDIDDETLLSALEGTSAVDVDADVEAQAVTQLKTKHIGLDDDGGKGASVSIREWSTTRVEDEIEIFLDELESSSQIARDLEIDNNNDNKHSLSSETRSISPKSSFDSDEFGISVEEIELLVEQTPQLIPRTESKPDSMEEDRRLMPPPMLPMKVTKPQNGPARRPHDYSSKMTTWQETPQWRTRSVNASSNPAMIMDAGFTSSQLERFVDDDLKLTQDSPG